MLQKLEARNQLYLLAISTIGSFLLASILVWGIWAGITHLPVTDMKTVYQNPELKPVLQLCNTLASVLVFGVPALVLYNIQHKQTMYQAKPVSGKQIFLLLVLVVVGVVLSAALVPIMQAIPISQQWSASFLQAEKDYALQIWSMLNLQSVGGLIGSLVIIAAIPAIVEELYFRATLQNLLVQYSQKVWLSIFISSILFSCIHFSYYGFLSRLVLSGILGFICYYAQTVWLSVLAHFLNNSFAVVELYVENQLKPLTPEHLWESFNDYLPWYYVLPAAAVLYMVMVAFRKECLRLYTVNSHKYE